MGGIEGFNLVWFFNLLVLFFEYIFYLENKIIIRKIRYGFILFLGRCLFQLSVINMIIYNKLDWNYLVYLIPLGIITAWFTYQYYKQKNSLYDYLYLGTITVLILVVMFYTF